MNGTGLRPTTPCSTTQSRSLPPALSDLCRTSVEPRPPGRPLHARLPARDLVGPLSDLVRPRPPACPTSAPPGSRSCRTSVGPCQTSGAGVTREARLGPQGCRTSVGPCQTRATSHTELEFEASPTDCRPSSGEPRRGLRNIVHALFAITVRLPPSSRTGTPRPR